MKVLPNEILSSYHTENPFWPTSRCFTRPSAHGLRVCGLTAVLALRFDKPYRWAVDTAHDLTVKEMSAMLKMSEDYVYGFMSGWDVVMTSAERHHRSREYWRGHKDGMTGLCHTVAFSSRPVDPTIQLSLLQATPSVAQEIRNVIQSDAALRTFVDGGPVFETVGSYY